MLASLLVGNILIKGECGSAVVGSLGVNITHRLILRPWKKWLDWSRRWREEYNFCIKVVQKFTSRQSAGGLHI
jgi:hypothetical protein